MRIALPVVLAAALGALPVAFRGGLVAVLVWLALTAAASGHAVAARGVPLWAALLAPLAWAALLLLLARDGFAPTATWSALGAAGLFGCGYGSGAGAARAAPGTSALLCLAAALVLLPLKGALGGAPWSARSVRLGVALFEASPATWLVESAGIDWMRAEGVYRDAGTDWFPPERRAVRGALAGPLLFVVGCAVALFVPRFTRGRRRSEEPEETRSG